MPLADLAMPTLRDSRLDPLPVAIIGAGPIGLAAAAQLHERGIEFAVYEAGNTVANSMRSWGHISLFSPWEFLVDPAARRLLEPTGWRLAGDLASARAVELSLPATGVCSTGNDAGCC